MDDGIASFLIYANNEKKSVLAQDLGDCRENYEKLAERVFHSFLNKELYIC